MPRAGRAPFEAIHIVGGGAQAPLLCQATADVAGVPVVAGPLEATVAGNMLCQLLAAGEIAGLEEGREIIRSSFQQTTYQPRDSGVEGEAYQDFLSLKPQ
jgi:sugar (pentulose or hexulose) kinase